MIKSNYLVLFCAFLVVSSCGESTIQETGQKLRDQAFLSTYQPMVSENVVIVNANMFDGLGNEYKDFDILIRDGKIQEIGQNLVIDGANIIDAEGKWVTPGIIDIHSHMGVYPAPGVRTSSDGNEATAPVTAEVWAEHSVWTQDPQFVLALKGGITSFHVLPGSANLMGGRGTTFKNVPNNSIQAMKFPEAPHSLKMACGENPKRVYGSRRQSPSTRMGNMAGYRKAWIDAQEYYEDIKDGKDVKRDLKNDTLAGVLRGEITVQNHCYRADEMMMMIEMSKEFNYQIMTFHHAVEAYKVADALAENGICAAMWADWWGFKHEAYDMVPANIAIVDQARGGTGCAIVHSDDAVGIQHLNQEAAKAIAAGNQAGYNISQARAMKWITYNPAKAAGILDQTGTLEVGKDADVVLWSGNPFSVYSKAEKVFIDGALAFDREKPELNPVTDFELGILNPNNSRIES